MMELGLETEARILFRRGRTINAASQLHPRFVNSATVWEIQARRGQAS